MVEKTGVPVEGWISQRAAMADIPAPLVANELLSEVCPKAFFHPKGCRGTKLVDSKSGGLVALRISGGWKQMYPNLAEQKSNEACLARAPLYANLIERGGNKAMQLLSEETGEAKAGMYCYGLSRPYQGHAVKNKGHEDTTTHLGRVRQIIVDMGKLGQQYAPEAFQEHMADLSAAASGLKEVWGEETGAFTNLAVPIGNWSKAHVDAQDMKLCVFVVLDQCGAVEKGAFALPEYKAYLPLNSGDMVVFAPSVQHCCVDTWGAPETPGAYRLGAVAYIKKGCATYAETNPEGVPLVAKPSAKSKSKRQRVA